MSFERPGLQVIFAQVETKLNLGPYAGLKETEKSAGALKMQILNLKGTHIRREKIFWIPSVILNCPLRQILIFYNKGSII